jgi:hypothetical protein
MRKTNIPSVVATVFAVLLAAGASQAQLAKNDCK